jgi:exosome complex component RRP45
MAGLQHFRRPDAVVKDGEVTVYGLDERVPIALNITHKPLTITFHTFNDGGLIVMDATRKEEQASEGDIVVALNDGGEICALYKTSGSPISGIDVVRKTSIALQKVREINRIINIALEADFAKRSKQDLGLEASAANDR